MAVAEELHFNRAADRLHISQPSLSQQIRRFEAQLGVTLLERTSRRVELTPAGRTLLRDGRRLLGQAQRVLDAARAAGAERLVVGFYGSAGGSLLSEIMRAFAAAHPSVDVAVRELRLARVDDILAGVDVAFSRLLPGQADSEIEVLAREPRVVALAAGHPLAPRTSLPFAALREERFITNPLVEESGVPVRWLEEQHRHGLEGRIAAEAESIQEILALVASGRGVCLVPASVAREYVRDDVRYIEVPDADRAVVSLVWARGDARPMLQAFVETARHTAGEAG